MGIMEMKILGIIIPTIISTQVSLLYTETLGPPQITSQAIEFVQVNFGENVKLPCPIKKVAFLPEWSKDGSIISSKHLGNRLQVGSRGLWIRNVTEDDAGLYKCTGVNGFGSASIDINMVVAKKDVHNDMKTGKEIGEKLKREIGMNSPVKLTKFTAKPRFSKVGSTSHFVKTVGQTMTFKCTARGNPAPDIVWFKDNETIDTQSRYVKIRGFMLTLENIQEGHSGIYRCNVSIVHGAISAHHTLQVIDQLKKPRFIGNDPVNVTVRGGETATFWCRINSGLFPILQWLKEPRSDEYADNDIITFNNTNLQTLGYKDMVREGKDIYTSKLVLKHVTDTDTGKYVCFAANRLGYSRREAYLGMEMLKQRESSGDLETFKVVCGITSAIIFLVIFLAAIFCAFTRCEFLRPICRRNISRAKECAATPTLVDKSSVISVNSGDTGTIEVPQV